MSEPARARVALLGDIWKTLVAPVMLMVGGLATFAYEAVLGHDQEFALMGLGMALTGAGLGADFLTRRLP